MSFNNIVYIAYLLITVFVILRVGHILYRSGRIFIVNCLHGDTATADAINSILLSGYYLMNTGYAVFVLKMSQRVVSWQGTVEAIATKTGGIVLALGIMHIFNVCMLLLSDRRRTTREQRMKKEFTESRS
jgi:hypothetical protein